LDFLTVPQRHSQRKCTAPRPISSDIRTLAAYYQRILKIAPQFTGESYAELELEWGH